jgi:hypothetical protein
MNIREITKRILLAIILGLAQLALPVPTLARGHSSGGFSGRHSSGSYRTKSYGHRSTYSGKRNHTGSRTPKRSRAARADFQRQHPCPATGKSSGACPGYVVDHVQPLACGGADAPSNMQWQTTAEGKAKDKWERGGCK